MKTLAQVEKEYILSVLEAKGGNRTQTSKVLDIGLRTLQRKLRAYGVTDGKAGASYDGAGRPGTTVYCQNTGETYPSVYAAAKSLGITPYVVNMSLLTGKPVKDLLFMRPSDVGAETTNA